MMADTEGAAPALSASRTRRRVVLAGAGGAALAAGIGVAWWRVRPRDSAPGAEAALWNLQFQTPQGSTIAMQSFRGKPLLLNFWATWCPPCVEEFPLLDSFYRQHAAKGWQVLGLAIDQPSAVRAFLAKLPVQFAIGLAGLEGTQLARDLGNLAGGLPYTVVFGAQGAALHRRMGRVTEADLQAWSQLS
jgi:thiol-disulfide isomerase/thioredoxin